MRLREEDLSMSLYRFTHGLSNAKEKGIPHTQKDPPATFNSKEAAIFMIKTRFNLDPGPVARLTRFGVATREARSEQYKREYFILEEVSA